MLARRRKGRAFDSLLSVLVFLVLLLEDTDSTELNRRLGHDFDVLGDVCFGIDGVWWQEHFSDRRLQRKLHKDEEDDVSGSGGGSGRGARMGEAERGQF